jgi:tetratricopeptide (TPR) repeat protein
MIRLFFIFAFSITVFAVDLSAEFDAANRLYEKADYSGAITAYQRIVSSGHASAAVLFNLANSEFKNGQPGRAIAHYRVAQQLAPRDPDIRANLRFARGSVPGNNTRDSALDRLFSLASLNEIGVLSAIGLWLWFGLLAAGQIRPAWKTTLRSSVIASGIFALAMSAWFCEALINRATNRIAVVTAPTSAVRFGPLDESQISFNVRDGSELRVIGHKDKWAQVIDNSNRTGWIPMADLTELP